MTEGEGSGIEQLSTVNVLLKVSQRKRTTVFSLEIIEGSNIGKEALLSAY